MSGLIYVHQTDRTFVAVDTLAIDPITKQPSIFASKCHHIPHLNLLVAGVGVMNMVTAWSDFLMNRLVCSNAIKPAKRHAKQVLADLAKDLSAKHSNQLSEFDSDIYTFGFDHGTGSMAGFRCGIKESFEPVDVGYQMGFRPGIIDPDELLETAKATGKTGDDQAFEIMRILSEKDKAKKGYASIGGNVLLFTLTKETLYFSKMPYELPDFAEHAQNILSKTTQ